MRRKHDLPRGNSEQGFRSPVPRSLPIEKRLKLLYNLPMELPLGGVGHSLKG
jgi:hypothetical protein